MLAVFMTLFIFDQIIAFLAACTHAFLHHAVAKSATKLLPRSTQVRRGPSVKSKNTQYAVNNAIIYHDNINNNINNNSFAEDVRDLNRKGQRPSL